MKIGIVLSGGGIRGIAHLGVLQALSAAGIRFDMISGTSAGSIVGALFAQGIEPYEILQIFLKTKILKFLRPVFGTTGLLSLDHTRSLFMQYLPHDSFSGLQIPLSITATDFTEGKLAYFSSGKLIDAVLASSSIPGFFKPIMIDGKMFVDGGVLNNFPIEPLRDNHCDFIIGSSCNHLPVAIKIVNFQKFIQRAVLMSINADMEMKSRYCDVLIEPEGMGATSIFDVKKAEEIYWLSYETTLKKLQTDSKLQQLITSSKIPDKLPQSA